MSAGKCQSLVSEWIFLHLAHTHWQVFRVASANGTTWHWSLKAMVVGALKAEIMVNGYWQ